MIGLELACLDGMKCDRKRFNDGLHLADNAALISPDAKLLTGYAG